MAGEIHLVFNEKSMEVTSKKLSTSDLTGNNERILVVEDEDNVRRFIVKALIKNGYEVMAAANVKEALAIFKKENGRFDLLFSDVVLPDKNGIKLIEELKPNNNKLRFILSSGYPDKKSQWERIQELGIPFLQKPFKLADLLQLVKDTIKSSK